MDPSLHSYGLEAYKASINTFKSLPANTYIHKDRNNNFIQTAGTYSWIKGAQALTSFVKGQTSTQLAKDLNEFAMNLIQQIDLDLQKALKSGDEKVKFRVYEEIKWIHREFELALAGKGPKGGLQGLISTYQENPEVKSSLEKTIHFIKDKLVEDMNTIQSNLTVERPTVNAEEREEEEFTVIEMNKYKENLRSMTEELKFINASIQKEPQLFTRDQIRYMIALANEALPDDEWLTVEESNLNDEIKILDKEYQRKEKLVVNFCQKFDAVLNNKPLSAKAIVDVLGLLEYEISNDSDITKRLESMPKVLGPFSDDIESFTKSCLLANTDTDQCLRGCCIYQHQLLRNDLQYHVASGVLDVEAIENRTVFLEQIDQKLMSSNKNHLRSADLETSLAISFHKLATYYRGIGDSKKCFECLENAGNISLLSTHPLGDIKQIVDFASAKGSYWVQVDSTAVRRRQARVQMKTFELLDGVKKQVLDLSFTLPRKEVQNMQEHIQLLNRQEESLKAKGILIDRGANVVYTASKMGVYQAEGKDSTVDKNLGQAICFKDMHNRISVKIGQDPVHWNQYEKISIAIDPSVTAQELHRFLSLLNMPTVLLNSRHEDIMNENIARIATSYYPDLISEKDSPEEWIAMAVNSPHKEEIIDRASKMTLKNLGLGKTEYVDKEATKQFVKAGGCGFGATIGFDSVSLSVKDIWYGDIYKKKSIEDTAWTLSLILKGGMMSTFERFERGFFGNGCCPGENIKVGAGNQVFVRPLTQNQFEQNHSWSDYAIEGNLFLMIDPSAAERLPYGYPFDRAGIRNKTYRKEKTIRLPQKELPMQGLEGKHVKDRKPLDQICKQQMQENRTLPTAEVLFEDVLPVSYIRGAIVTSESDKAIVIKTLKDNNIHSINGVAVEKCIHVSQTFDLRILEQQ